MICHTTNYSYIIYNMKNIKYHNDKRVLGGAILKYYYRKIVKTEAKSIL